MWLHSKFPCRHTREDHLHDTNSFNPQCPWRINGIAPMSPWSDPFRKWDVSQGSRLYYPPASPLHSYASYTCVPIRAYWVLSQWNWKKSARQGLIVEAALTWDVYLLLAEIEQAEALEELRTREMLRRRSKVASRSRNYPRWGRDVCKEFSRRFFWGGLGELQGQNSGGYYTGGFRTGGRHMAYQGFNPRAMISASECKTREAWI